MKAYFLPFLLLGSITFCHADQFERARLIVSPHEAEVRLQERSDDAAIKAAVIQQLFLGRLERLAERAKEFLSDLLELFDELEEDGFDDDELDSVKLNLMQKLGVVYGSEDALRLEKITWQEIWNEVQELLSDENLRIALRSLEDQRLLSRKEVEKLRLATFIPHLAENELTPPSDNWGDEEDIDDPFLEPLDTPANLYDNITEYSQLPLYDWEKQTITYIVTNIAEKNVFQLLLDKKEMEKKGRKINQVHPLRFIGYICAESKLKRSLRLAKKNTFKWDNFVAGLDRRMREEAARNNLVRFVPGLGEHLNIDPAEIMPYIQGVDCEGLLRFLIAQ